MPKKILIALPPAMLMQIDQIATVEHRTRSDLVREALRRYMAEFARTAPARVALEMNYQTKVAETPVSG